MELRNLLQNMVNGYPIFKGKMSNETYQKSISRHVLYYKEAKHYEL